MCRSPTPTCPASAVAGNWKRRIVAVLIGLICSAALWVATPYNNYLLLNSPIADDYLPVGPIFIILVIVLAINPLIRRFRATWALSRGQLATALAIMLVACVVPGHGLMRSLPYMLARNPVNVNANKVLSEQYRKMDLPEGMFPDRFQRGGATPAGDHFARLARPDNEVPWKAWARPLAVWGLLVLFGWMMMIGLSVIVLPQWRDNERLAFPLLTVQGSLIQDPGPGKLLAPIFRQRTFWVAAGAVFLLHVLAGMKVYMPERVAAIPLKWNLGSLFSEEPWSNLPVYFHTGRIFFTFVGLAFFMPNRIGLSIWFFIVAYAFYRMFGMAYHPPFDHGTMADHRTGAMLAMTVAILWIGRAHWARVGRAMFEKKSLGDSGWLFVLGLAGIFGWLIWVGLSPGWAAMLVGFAFMISLLIARVVAETGMPFMRLQGDAIYLMKLAPMNWLSPLALFLASVVTILFPVSSRVSGSAMAVQAMGLAEDPATGEKNDGATGRWGDRAKKGDSSSSLLIVAPSPRRPIAPSLFLAVLVLGLLVAGASHLSMGYHHDVGADGKELNSFGSGAFTTVNKGLEEISRGELSHPRQNVEAHITFGVVLAGLLYWLSMTIPTWPLHPIGLLLIDTPSYGNKVWASVFVGWAIKGLVVRFGGTMGYRAARPAFLGVIMGEVFAAVFWAIAQLVLVNQGVTLRALEVLPG